MLCVGLAACQPEPGFVPLDNGFPELAIKAVRPPEHELAAPDQPVSVAPPTATPAQEGPPPPDWKAIEAYLRAQPPDVLIRLFFAELGQANVNRALAIARRESGLGKRGTPVAYDPACSADNPRSSASGLFQYLDDWAGWGGFAWADIVGPDCLTDVLMTVAVVRSQGWGPWQ